MVKKLIVILLFVLSTNQIIAQVESFTRQDSLRGTVTPERAWWDLSYYHLKLAVDPVNKALKGSNEVIYKVLESNNVLQIDLQPPLKITKVVQDNKKLEVKSEGNAHFIQLEKNQKVGAVESLTVYYEGVPHEAKRAPWDGGITWTKDENGNPFVASSCQGIGASIWWPCKDHMYDEVDSMLISVEVPEKLMNVSNGRLIQVKKNKKRKTKTYDWFVSNPIANYGVNINVGDYVHFGEKYAGEKGALDLDYYVLRNNLEKAKSQFKDAPRMLKAFEHWFGPYPFYEDGYKLVEAPYLGMEHQSSVTYGNKYGNGYLGIDLSQTGWGLKFDFIIIHESGHEWFANNITYADVADMWIHESFTNYSESLFVEYYYGKEAGQEYVRGMRTGISNDIPIIGKYGVNNRGSGDMYNKGGNLLNTLRQLINDDEKWRSILRGLNETFYHQVVTTEQIESYIQEKSGLELTTFFNQYLRDTRIPTLQYYIADDKLNYSWSNAVSGFDMPVDITLNGEKIRLSATHEWAELPANGASDIVIDPNYYVAGFKLR